MGKELPSRDALDKLARSNVAMVSLARITHCLRHLFSYRPYLRVNFFLSCLEKGGNLILRFLGLRL